MQSSKYAGELLDRRQSSILPFVLRCAIRLLVHRRIMPTLPMTAMGRARLVGYNADAMRDASPHSDARDFGQRFATSFAEVPVAVPAATACALLTEMLACRSVGRTIGSGGLLTTSFTQRASLPL